MSFLDRIAARLNAFAERHWARAVEAVPQPPVEAPRRAVDLRSPIPLIGAPVLVGPRETAVEAVDAVIGALADLQTAIVASDPGALRLLSSAARRLEAASAAIDQIASVRRLH